MDNQEIVQDQQSVNQTSIEQPQETSQVRESEEPTLREKLQEKLEAKTAAPAEKTGEVGKAARKVAENKAAPATDQAKPVFQPNFKVKALDKEHDIPEWLRSSIKDAETEKQARELFLKAIGMDHIKPKYQETRQKYEEVNTHYKTQTAQIAELRSHVQKGDFDSFFEKLQIPTEKILQYAVQKVRMMELPPEQQQAIAARRDSERRAAMLEQQNAQLSEQTMQHAVQSKEWQLQLVMQRPDVSSFAEAYDRAKGKSGSFRDVVIRTGEAAYYSRQQDLTAEEAIKEAMSLIGPMSLAQNPAAQTQQSTPQVIPKAQAKPPVIPNIQGNSSASPTRNKPMSTADLRKKYAEMQKS